MPNQMYDFRYLILDILVYEFTKYYKQGVNITNGQGKTDLLNASGLVRNQTGCNFYIHRKICHVVIHVSSYI
jgi:hypothetical protein